MTRKPLWTTEDVYESPKEKSIDPWATFETSERIAMMPPKLAKAAQGLGIVVEELKACVTLYELAITLNQESFLKKVRRSSHSNCHASIRNVIVAAFRNVCIGLPGIFDKDQNAIDLRRIINPMFVGPERQAILDFHSQTSQEARVDANRMLEKMTFLRRRMNTGKFKDALESLSNMRNKQFAHFDYNEGHKFTALATKNVNICLINSVRLTDLACRVLIQRVYMLPEMQMAARNEAVALRDTLSRGAL